MDTVYSLFSAFSGTDILSPICQTLVKVVKMVTHQGPRLVGFCLQMLM